MIRHEKTKELENKLSAHELIDMIEKQNQMMLINMQRISEAVSKGRSRRRNKSFIFSGECAEPCMQI